jgi:fatty acid desaturase
MTETTPDAQDQSEYNVDNASASAAEDNTTRKLTGWAKAAGIRALKTAAQSAIAIIPVSAITIGGVDWIMVAGAAALAGILSLFNSIAGIPEVSDGDSIRQITCK